MSVRGIPFSMFPDIQRRLLISNYIIKRSLITSCIKFNKSKEAADESFDVLKELRPAELTEEEIEHKRIQHRLPEKVYRKFIQKEALPIVNECDFKMNRLRAYYGRHGRESGLNPGILWPTREEILETIHYDKMFYPPLKDMLSNIEKDRLAKEQSKKEKEEEVDKNMQNLDKWIAEFHAKKVKKEEQAKELKLKREKLIDEVSEFLGYEIDPKDPRFDEAMALKEKEKKKKLKAKKQQESYERMMVKLRQMAEKES